jgi:peptide/nickel transport system substrate-binding protein
MFTDRKSPAGLLKCLGLATAAVTLVAGPAAAQDVLRVALTDEPPHLDVHVTTAGLTSVVNMHITETPYTFSANGQPVPLLIESETISEDGKTVVMTLREGVTFHDGSDMTAEDVVASLDRWGTYGGRGKILYDKLDSVEATGEHEVTLQFNAVYGPWKNLLAFNNGGPAILPAEIVAEASGEPLEPEQIIGTGPYRFSEWRPNRYIEVVAFEDYDQPPGEADGYAGQRDIEFDTIRFVAVPDIGTRVSGVQAGDYHYAERIPGDLFAELDEDERVKTVRHGTPQALLVFFNSTDGIFAENYALRRAIVRASGPAEAMAIAVGPEELWSATLNVYQDGHFWATGTEEPATGAPEEAMGIAEEAGYGGEPIRFMAASSYPLHYDVAQVLDQQLKNAGFNIDFQVYDWPTLVERRGQSDLWDMFITTHGAMPDPVLYTFMNDNYPGWWVSPEKEALEAEFTATADTEERMRIWSEIQALMHEQVPVLKPGDAYLFDIASPELDGLGDRMDLFWPVFWNVKAD